MLDGKEVVTCGWRGNSGIDGGGGGGEGGGGLSGEDDGRSAVPADDDMMQVERSGCVRLCIASRC